MKDITTNPYSDCEPEVNWKKMYIIMLVAADSAVSSIEQGDFPAAAEFLKTAMLACEDEYIDNM